VKTSLKELPWLANALLKISAFSKEDRDEYKEVLKELYAEKLLQYEPWQADLWAIDQAARTAWHSLPEDAKRALIWMMKKIAVFAPMLIAWVSR
jgi:hypothetical protein